MSSNTTVQPALHSGRMPIKEAMARWGTMCPVKMVGRPGIAISHLCVERTMLPSGKLILSGFLDSRLLSTSTPSMIKIDVAPVSAMAWSVAMEIPAAISGCVGRVLLDVEQFDATTVTSSCIAHDKFMVGSEETVVAETKFSNLFAVYASAPNRQVYVGSTFLCIPFVHAL